jgi:periplasmic protein TonB
VIESSLPARRQSRGEWAVGVSLSLVAHLALIGLLWDRAVGPVADVPAFIEVPVEVIVEPSTSTNNEAAASDNTTVETADEDKPDPERSEAPEASPAEQLAIAEPDPPAAIGPALAQAEGSLAGISQSLQSRGDVPASDGLPNSPSMLTEPALTAQRPPGARRSVLSPQVRSKEPPVQFANKRERPPRTEREPRVAPLAQPKRERSRAPANVAVEHRTQRGLSQSRLAALGSASPAMEGGSVAVASHAAAYRAQVIAHLTRFKRYPVSAQTRGAGGTPAVAFALDGGGRVLRVALARSSGHADIDAETLAMVRRAVPFPPPPPSAPHAFTVSIGFHLQ